MILNSVLLYICRQSASLKQVLVVRAMDYICRTGIRGGGRGEVKPTHAFVSSRYGVMRRQR